MFINRIFELSEWLDTSFGKVAFLVNSANIIRHLLRVPRPHRPLFVKCLERAAFPLWLGATPKARNEGQHQSRCIGWNFQPPTTYQWSWLQVLRSNAGQYLLVVSAVGLLLVQSARGVSRGAC